MEEKTWKRKSLQAQNGYKDLDYAASNNFRSAGVKPDSTSHSISTHNG
jgi:hypothetical protein